ncbi:F-box/WD repeat-containing protein 9 [Desmophyllum pertusum]|uniref:F-box/WD repeat-containing protein 9 n=1 Tax=Desmophyllum pertusum TaxID=174260 RepID=A0A9X0D684_9CNID|nr:F-box/WD repeat-containing protein 9 [Desmophyllum pertusum]
MDADECQGCCNGDLQNGDDQGHNVKPQPLCCRDLQVENKSPITTENLNLCCHGDCCVPTVSTSDTLTRQTVTVNNVKSPDTFQRTQNNPLSLAALPPELILVIFSYLEAQFTLRVLTCVCRLFHNLLSPESSWKTRFGKRWPQRDKREDFDYVSSWKSICVQHEDMDKFWRDPDSSLDFYELKDQHFATVDAVHVMKSGDLCISGSRDRSVGVWSLNALADPSEAGYTKKSFRQSLDGHKGWVWCLSSDPTGAPRVCSGSWDSKIKLWDLQGQNVEMTTISVHRAAVLCLAWEQEILISGSYDKSISLWDLRGGNSISMLKNHSKPVLCLSADDRFIISGSEDKTLSVYDRRAAQVYKTVKLESPVFSLCHSTTCGYNYLRVGGREGRLYLLDTTGDKFEEITPSMDLGSTGKISGMCHYGGAVVACSTDRTIKVLEPSRVLSVIHSFDCHSGEVASVSSRGSVLASCSSDLSIGIWRPKTLRPDPTI